MKCDEKKEMEQEERKNKGETKMSVKEKNHTCKIKEDKLSKKEREQQ